MRGGIVDPRKYYVEECYAMTNCLHCPDCLAFALKFFKEIKSKEKARERNLVVKFILSTIASENLPCEKALPANDLKSYINQLLEGQGELPICHYEFQST